MIELDPASMIGGTAQPELETVPAVCEFGATNTFVGSLLVIVSCTGTVGEGEIETVSVVSRFCPTVVSATASEPVLTDGELVRAKEAELDTPATVALTLYGPPAVLFAVTVALATPSVLVMAVTVLVIPGPLVGPLKDTVTPGTGLLPASFTVASNGFAKAVLTRALCPPPLPAAMETAELGALAKL